MKPEEIVCTLQQAKELKALGVKQDSYFYWGASPFKGEHEEVYNIDRLQLPWNHQYIKRDYISAFTSEELGKLIQKHGVFCVSSPESCEDYWEIGFSQKDSKLDYYNVCEKTEVLVKAKLLIDLLQHRWAGSEEEVNDRWN